MKTFNEEIEDCIQQSRYDEAAELVAQKLSLEWTINFLKNDKYFEDDKDVRDIYTIGLKRGSRDFHFNFGQSINDSGFYYTVGKKRTTLDRKYLEKDYFKGKPLGLVGTIRMKDHSFTPSCTSDYIHYPKKPNLYDILCCLTKYDPGTFENFCGDFGYDEDSRTAYKIYKTVKEEYMNMCSLFSDKELELLSLIN